MAQPLSAFESDQLHCTSSLLDSMHTDGPPHNFTKHPDLPGPEDGAPTLALARADGQHAVLGARTSAGAGKPGKARSMRDTGAGLSLALYRACTLHNSLRRPSSALNQPLPATDSSLSTPPCKEARPYQTHLNPSPRKLLSDTRWHAPQPYQCQRQPRCYPADLSDK
jgi:hypothetical protein